MKKKIIRGIIIIFLLPLFSVISCKKDLGVDLNRMGPPSGPFTPLIMNIVWEVDIKMLGFDPVDPVIFVGDSVKWVSIYNENGDHTVTADDSTFYSGTILLGGIYERVFNDTGAFRYHCSVHSAERGVLYVKDPNRH